MTQESLSEAVDAALTAPGTIRVQAGGTSAEIEVIDADRIGVVVERVRVSGVRGDVTGRAERLADAVHPAGTDLTPIEVAPELGGAVLRTPAEELQGGRYYQVEVGPERAELTRHKVGDGGQRQPEPFTLTREQLGEVVEGMAGALRE